MVSVRLVKGEKGIMVVEKRELAIIGGGPAGLAAAIEAAKAGVHVLLIDENERPGGQLFKQIHKFFGSKAHNAGIRGMNIGEKLLKETEQNHVDVWLGSFVSGIYEGNRLSIVKNIEGEKKLCTVQAEKILICCGGAENAVNFPGWDLPGVMGAGAAQTMANVHKVLPGKRVLMVGSGNVGLIVSYQLMQAGADVVGIVEAAPKIGGYGVHAAKIRRAGVPFYLSHTIKCAIAEEEEVSQAVIVKLDENFNQIPGTEQVFDVDTVCIATGLRPLSQLAWMYDVKHDFIPELGGWMPLHNENMESSVPGVYVAGDTAGVEEANTAMDEGRLAGTAIAEALGYLKQEEAEEQKRIIRERLEALRLGPFGERRLNAKNRIVERGVN